MRAEKHQRPASERDAQTGGAQMLVFGLRFAELGELAVLVVDEAVQPDAQSADEHGGAGPERRVLAGFGGKRLRWPGGVFGFRPCGVRRALPQVLRAGRQREAEDQQQGDRTFHVKLPSTSESWRPAAAGAAECIWSAHQMPWTCRASTRRLRSR